MDRNYIKKNIITFSILTFVLFFILLNVVQPGFMYTYNGNIREFGINQKHKTILPIWLIAIIIAIFSYLGILFYVSYPKLNFKSI